MRIGYSYWGFLSDIKTENGIEVSTPDGNAAYSWSIIYEMKKRGYSVYNMQKNRDRDPIINFGYINCFSSFSKEKRIEAYEHMIDAEHSFPELDLLLLEWRFPIPGRNCVDFRDHYGQSYSQGDLDRQTELLNHYSKTNTVVVIWDLDYKLTRADEMSLLNLFGNKVVVIDTAIKSKEDTLIARYHVSPPFIMDDILQFKTNDPWFPTTRKDIVYIGSRYERDKVIDKYVAPYSRQVSSNSVHFYGNWEKTLNDCMKRWPRITFHYRITMKDFQEVLDDAVSVPLLAKQDYIDNGFWTPRAVETVLFGSIPVAIRDMLGHEKYSLFSVKDGNHMIDVVRTLLNLDERDRHIVREETAHRLFHCDAKYFVDKLEMEIL